MTIVLGCEDSNGLGERVIWDDVSLDAVPEASTMSLLALGGLAMLRRRRK